MLLILISLWFQVYKMRYLFLLLTPLLCLADTNSAEISKLEARIKQLELDMNSSHEDIDELESIVNDVERKSFTDIIDFTPEVRLRFDKMKYKVGSFESDHDPINNTPSREDIDKEFDLATSVRFRLNMRASVMDDMEFHGRFVFQHSTQSNERLCILSKSVKSSGSVTGVDIDRAYFDYHINGKSDYPLIFSFGILPTSGGTPMQFAEVRARQSVFPALVFDMDSYGAIFTSNLTNLFDQASFLRLVTAQAYTLDPNIYPYQCNRETIDNADIYGLYFDTHLNKKTLLSMGVNVLGHLKAHPYLGPDVSAENSSRLGTMVSFGIGLDSEHILDSGVTTFIHTAASHGHSNGNSDDYGEGSDGNFTSSDYAEGKIIEEWGYAVYAGLLYDISSSVTLGGEYNFGSEYWFAATQGAEDMYNKLATRGHVAEGYAIWNINRYLFTKIGYMYTLEDYTGSGWHFGSPIAKGGQQQVAYLQLNASF